MSLLALVAVVAFLAYVGQKWKTKLQGHIRSTDAEPIWMGADMTLKLCTQLVFLRSLRSCFDVALSV